MVTDQSDTIDLKAMSTYQSILIGARSSGGFFVSTFLFGIMFGIAATSVGINQWHTLLASAAVFSASAQFAALEFWQSPLPLGTIALAVVMVSTRNILLGMSIAYHFDGHSLIRRILWLFLLNDPGVVTATQVDEKVDRLGYVTGYGIALFTSWTISTWIGITVANIFADTDLSSLKFAGSLVLATMMILFIRGSNADAKPWVVSGIASLLFFEIGVPIHLILPTAISVGVISAVALGRASNA